MFRYPRCEDADRAVWTVTERAARCGLSIHVVVASDIEQDNFFLGHTES